MTSNSPPETRRGTRKWLQRLLVKIDGSSKTQGEHRLWTGKTDNDGKPVSEHVGRKHAVRRVIYAAYHGLLHWDEVPVPTCGEPLCIAPEHVTKCIKGSPTDRLGGYQSVQCPRCERWWMSPDPSRQRACPGEDGSSYGCAARNRDGRMTLGDTWLTREERQTLDRNLEALEHRVRTKRYQPPVKEKKSLAQMCRELSRKVAKREGETDAQDGNDPGSPGEADEGGVERQEPEAGGSGAGPGLDGEREGQCAA